MGTLLRLSFLKKKAKIRNLFSRPSTAILTVVIAAYYILIFLIPMINQKATTFTFEQSQQLIMTSLGVVLFLNLITFMQSRRALFFVEDSYYMFTGPFTNRQILALQVVDSALSALLFAGISLFPMVYLSSSMRIPYWFIGQLFLVNFLISFSLISLFHLLYLRELIRGKKTKTHQVLFLLLIAMILAIFAYAYVSSGFDLQAGINTFMNSQLFYFVPLFGWGKYALGSLLLSQNLGYFLGLGSLLVAAVLVAVVMVNSKGYFFEQAMIDSEEFTDYYKKARSGQTDNNISGKTVRQVKMKFRKKEGAIYSKSLLVTLKSGSLIQVRQLLSIAFLVGIAYFQKMNFIALLAMMLFVLFSLASSSGLTDDLKHHYIYLIPGNPFLKLINASIIPFIKNAIICTVGLVAGGILLGEPIQNIILFLLFSYSMMLIFQVSSIVNLRILRSQSNKMLETTIGFLVVLVAQIPAVLVLGILYLVMGQAIFSLALVLGLMAVFNVVMSIIGIRVCAPMLNKGSISAE